MMGYPGSLFPCPSLPFQRPSSSSRTQNPKEDSRRIESLLQFYQENCDAELTLFI